MEENKKKSGFRARLIEIWRRLTPEGKDNFKNKIYFNGENNLYPYEVEAAINGSPTASRASKMMRKFIAGRGLVDPSQDVIVNDDKDKLSKIIGDIAEDLSIHGGCFIHVGYDGSLKPASLSVLDYVQCRKLIEDDAKNDGKIVVYDWAKEKTKINASREAKCLEEWYYPFNSQSKVVAAQIRRDNGLKDDEAIDPEEHLSKYRGQVYYLNLTPRYKYSLSPVNPAYNDANSESQFGMYRNIQLRSGFMGKTLVLTSGLDDESEKDILETIDKWLGSENSGAAAHISIDNVEDLDKKLVIKQIKAQFDDKLFEVSEKSVRRNLLGSFNNIPPALVDSGEGALFGTSGDAYYQMKLFYSEQTEDERYRITEALTSIGFPCEIEPIVRPPKTTEELKTEPKTET